MNYGSYLPNADGVTERKSDILEQTKSRSSSWAKRNEDCKEEKKNIDMQAW